MEMNFVPECFFDTLIVITILGIKKVNHQKCCTKVANTMKRIDDFAVGIIDKDKYQIEYLKEFDEHINTGNLILWVHKNKKKRHYFIQIVPAIEKWVLLVAKEANIKLSDFGLPTDLNKLGKRTKTDNIDDDPVLIKFCQHLVSCNSKSMAT